MNSPARRKLKNTVQAAAQSMMQSGASGRDSDDVPSFCMMSIVMGSRTLVRGAARASTRLSPSSTYSNLGIAPSTKGLPIEVRDLPAFNALQVDLDGTMLETLVG